MRKLMILALLGIAMIFNSASAQNKDKVYDFVSVQQQPEYPGGMKAFYSYLSKNITYPESAKKNKEQGKVFLSFIVNKDGSLTDLQIIRGLSESLNQEAIRVLKASPKWNPAKLNKQIVRVKYNLAVNFSLG
ncbi:energy transducer TonB [Pedobacter fastidiosus]|uniref:Energy transducer TonB n=1 Tax=Pedobacter fastidiosus TaxID=2765361 RepID=A0ABR7KLG9_9SPHI|nr:energy transducer TonB [Pedobacter fastidiosus]MBC6108919.1 energy transducer TonB [Pedobacter fastidiosus]